MMPRVSVITVVRNDAQHIRQTLQSALAQVGVEVELLVKDGASTDGTTDVISECLALWTTDAQAPLIHYTSSADQGMYDAMNQCIMQATGEWVSILNSGDVYTTATSLADAIARADADSDVIFGHSIEVNPEWNHEIRALADTTMLRYAPTFRHGSALVRTAVHKTHLFDLSQQSRLGYALDWEMLHRLWCEGARFQMVDVFVESYRAEGVSNHPYRNLLYNYRIVTTQPKQLPQQGTNSAAGARKVCSKPKAMLRLLKDAAYICTKNLACYAYARSFVIEYMINDILPHIPFWSWRRFYLRRIGMQIGDGSFIMKRNTFINPNLVKVGKNSHINTQCIIDGRGGIEIGDSVSISHRVNIMTGSHDFRSTNFQGVFKPIIIEDYVWIGIGATILQGVTIGRGAVVSAGAVVTKDVAPYTVVAGIPAKVIAERSRDLNYKCIWDVPLT